MDAHEDCCRGYESARLHQRWSPTQRGRQRPETRRWPRTDCPLGPPHHRSVLFEPRRPLTQIRAVTTFYTVESITRIVQQRFPIIEAHMPFRTVIFHCVLLLLCMIVLPSAAVLADST